MEELKEAFSAYYDITEEGTLGELPITFRADYNRRDERYFLSKSIKVWGSDNHQSIYVSRKESVTIGDVKAMQEALREETAKLKGSEEHMSTILVGVLITEHAPEEVLKEARRYRALNFFRFGLHGWVESYIAIVTKEQASIHRKGKFILEPIEKQMQEVIS